ncbi:MAG: SLAP domain-containing protein, partial [Lactobacillus sp.]|nr:SLAP domain-containing protein [Lactobacillus sp.]
NLSKAGVNVPGNDWEAAAKGGLISVNGQMPSLTNADANVYLVTAKDTLVNGQKYQPGQLILKRTVNVDADQGAFKTDKINGVVTVNMNDGMAAQVYDENGKQVLGRALPNKSAWKSFEKRTYYKDGQVFYQVSTNEYVRAQDVTFTSNSSSSNSSDQLSGKVNVTKYPEKVITLDNRYLAG